MAYKWCVVPQCTNTSVKTPEKLFVSVPKNAKMRKKWLVMARRNPNDIVVNSVVYFCEDHFEMEKDIANYNQYKMGFSRRLLLVDGVLPSKFHCQGKRRKMVYDCSTRHKVSTKRQKLKITKECVNKTPFNSDNVNRTNNDDDRIEMQVAVTPEFVDELDQADDVPNQLIMYYNVDTNLLTTEENKYESRDKESQCANCNDDIFGYKYTCVQCDSFNLCAACEFSGAHASHYMLRVPGPRPNTEIQTILSNIRKNLTRELLNPIPSTGFGNGRTVRVETEFNKSENILEKGSDQQVDALDEDPLDHESGRLHLSFPGSINLDSTISKDTSQTNCLGQYKVVEGKIKNPTAILVETYKECIEPKEKIINVIDKGKSYQIILPHNSNAIGGGEILEISDYGKSERPNELVSTMLETNPEICKKDIIIVTE